MAYIVRSMVASRSSLDSQNSLRLNAFARFALFSSALSMAMAPTFALAQQTVVIEGTYRPIEYSPGSGGGSGVPLDFGETKRPTNKIKNVISLAKNNACVRSGKTAVACGTAAAATGGIGYSIASTNGWAQIKSGLSEGATAAAVGAAIGCAGGAAALAIGGPLAGAGCGIGALQVGIVSGLFGFVNGFANYSEDGEIKIDQSGNLRGSKVAQTGLNSSPNGGGVQVATSAAQGGLCNTRNIRFSINPATLQQDVSFPVGLTSTTFAEGFLVPTSRYNNANWVNFSKAQTLFVSDGCSGTPTVPAGEKRGQLQGVTGSFALPAGVSAYVIGNITYPTAAAVPVTQYRVVEIVPFFAAPWSDVIDPTALGKSVDPNVLAAMANASSQAAGVAGDYDPAYPVTAQDVASALQHTGPVSMLDMMRPTASPEAPGATSPQNMLPEPTRVVDNRPGANQGTSDKPTVTEEKAKTDIDSLWGGGLGSVTEPIEAAFLGPVAAFLSPTIDIPQGSCPIVSVDLMQMFTGMPGAVVGDTEYVCDWLNGYRPTVVALMHVYITIIYGLYFVRRIA